MQKLSVKLITILILQASIAINANAETETYTIDAQNSTVGFKVRNFFSTVTGKFHKFSGTIKYDEANLENCSAEAAIDVTSVDTENKKRDNHLNQDDYFHTTKYPNMTFKSTKWESLGDGKFKISGDLTIMNTTKPVVLEAKLLGKGSGRGGKVQTAWEAKSSVIRQDFGLTGGKAAIGSEVTIELFIEANKETPPS